MLHAAASPAQKVVTMDVAIGPAAMTAATTLAGVAVDVAVVVTDQNKVNGIVLTLRASLWCPVRTCLPLRPRRRMGLRQKAAQNVLHAAANAAVVTTVASATAVNELKVASAVRPQSAVHHAPRDVVSAAPTATVAPMKPATTTRSLRNQVAHKANLLHPSV